jgi:type IX secretion system PorP/SprF family membrane protein
LRKILLVLTVISFTTWEAKAQDAPLFTQKLTNSFLYNPSVAGNTFGSITLSHRKFWSGVEGSPSTTFFSVHTPFAQHRFGTGLNFYQDKVGITKSIYAAAAFAYHIRINDNNMLSFGLSGEFNNMKLSGADVIHENDPLLTGDSRSAIDFSFGTSYKSKYFQIGAAANRLNALTGVIDTVTQFPAFYSGFFQLNLPFADDKFLFEPMVTVRSFAKSSPQIDAGAYFTAYNTVLVGGSYRTGGALNASAAFKYKNIMLGYSRDIITSDIRQGLGATNEISIRFDFNDQSYYMKQRNARAISTKAMTIRRKTLSTYSHRGTSMQQSKRYKKNIRRKQFMSPNYRMNASKKLMTKKVSGRKPSYQKKRRR